MPPSPQTQPPVQLAPSAPETRPADELNPELPDALQAPFDLIVNEVGHGQILLVLAKDDVFVRRADLIDAGIAPLAGTDQLFFGEAMLSLKSVSPPLKYKLDEHDIALRITAPPRLLPKTTLDLAGIQRGIQYQERTSGFLNYSVRASALGNVDVYHEMGASHEGNLFLTSAILSNYREPVRGLTSFTINERETRRRLIFGDAVASTGNLGSGVVIGGWTFQRTYDLDPYAIVSPRIGFQGETLTPATLDVYVNGARVRSESIQPGTFQLNNLRVGGGRGMATYVIRDVFGQEQTISLPFYISGNVLSKGLDEFSYSIGALREDLDSNSWGYKRLGLLGRHRYGVSNHVTVSARAEATDRLVNGGGGLTAITPAGQLEVSLAGSGERGAQGGAGGALFASYSYLSLAFSAGFFGSLSTNRYSTINTTAAEDRSIRNIGIYQATPLGRRYSLSATGLHSATRSGQTVWQASLYGTARLFGNLTASLNLGYSYASDTGREWSITSGLSYTYLGNHLVSGQHRVTNGDSAVILDANRPLPVGPGYGYRLSSTIDSASTLLAGAQYQTTAGRYGVAYLMQNSDGHTRHALGAEAAGSLVVVPKVGLFAGLPVTDGFGVIRVPNVANVRGYINNQEIGRTNREGNLVVPNVLSYYGNQLRIDPNDVPYQYSIDKSVVTLAPSQRGVVVAEFGLSRPHFFRGSVLIEEGGKRVVPQFGQVRIETSEGEALSPIGESGEFDLMGVPFGKQRLLVDYTGGTCILEINMPDTGETVIDLGELVCRMH